MAPQPNSPRPSIAPSGSITVLGIETSCDDTAVAVVRRSLAGDCKILSNERITQLAQHEAYGGIVPEIAARSHVDHLDTIVSCALERAGVSISDIDLIAVTGGPGLIGGVIVGLTTAKAMAIAHEKPLIVVNHLEAHALSARMTEPAQFPYLLLLVSGGHTQLIAVEGVGAYRRLGTTIDDAAGEAFDKTAKLLGLGQPGGPVIQSAAERGDPTRFAFPKPLAHRNDCDFSFSGLKTAVRLAAEELSSPTRQDISDIAASFQKAAVDHLIARTEKAMAQFDGRSRHLVIAGGVAANKRLRSSLEDMTRKHGWEMFAPPFNLCTDNGAMVAWAGAERLSYNGTPPLGHEQAAGPLANQYADALAFAPRARWPLAPPIEGRAHGGGKRGPKA